MFLIDCGDSAPIIENINNRGLHLKGIFITHSHFDHIYGLDSIIDEYPETPIYISALGKEGLYSDKLNLSRYSLCPYVFQYYSVMKELKEGDTVYLYGSAGVEVYETPGHDRSCLTYKFGNCLFTFVALTNVCLIINKLQTNNRGIGNGLETTCLHHLHDSQSFQIAQCEDNIILRINQILIIKIIQIQRITGYGC